VIFWALSCTPRICTLGLPRSCHPGEAASTYPGLFWKHGVFPGPWSSPRGLGGWFRWHAAQLLGARESGKSNADGACGALDPRNHSWPSSKPRQAPLLCPWTGRERSFAGEKTTRCLGWVLLQWHSSHPPSQSRFSPWSLVSLHGHKSELAFAAEGKGQLGVFSLSTLSWPFTCCELAIPSIFWSLKAAEVQPVPCHRPFNVNVWGLFSSQ